MNNKHFYKAEESGELRVSEIHPLFGDIERPARPVETLLYKTKNVINNCYDSVRLIFAEDKAPRQEQ